MSTILTLLEARLQAVPGAEAGRVTPISDPKFGDFQTNVAMTQAKARRANPRALAAEIVAALQVDDVCTAPEIAGAGFINFRLRPEWLAARFAGWERDVHLGVPQVAPGRTLVLDFSSPNVAKPMHVGHIRSTILGDALARVAEALGYRTVRDNHIGDWGTQFGMLLLGWKTELDPEALAREPIDELERLYKLVSARMKPDPATGDRAREELVALQRGDEENLRIWREMIRLSQAQFDAVYGRLGIRFDVTLGESFYNPQLAGVVEELRARGLARESDGATCVFSDGTGPPEQDPFLIKDQEGWRPNPAMVQKSDGAANYTTTDLATLQYRCATWEPEAILYVTDGRQQLHFRQLFAIFARWQPEAAAATRLAHVWFGAILGDDGRPFKTRSGENIRLTALLDEAEERAGKLLAEKDPDLSEGERREVARMVGIGAVKYADLSPNRQTDYVFAWDRMLSFQGNTAPYLQNAYVRTQSILRKAEASGLAAGTGEFVCAEPGELALLKKLYAFADAVPAVLEDHRPNLLANYLYELAGLFHAFFEACPVLRAPEPVRGSRLRLAAAAGRVLRRGLGLLGIETPERM